MIAATENPSRGSHRLYWLSKPLFYPSFMFSRQLWWNGFAFQRTTAKLSTMVVSMPHPGIYHQPIRGTGGEKDTKVLLKLWPCCNTKWALGGHPSAPAKSRTIAVEMVLVKQAPFLRRGGSIVPQSLSLKMEQNKNSTKYAECPAAIPLLIFGRCHFN